MTSQTFLYNTCLYKTFYHMRTLIGTNRLLAVNVFLYVKTVILKDIFNYTLFCRISILNVPFWQNTWLHNFMGEKVKSQMTKGCMVWFRTGSDFQIYDLKRWDVCPGSVEGNSKNNMNQICLQTMKKRKLRIQIREYRVETRE